MLLKSGRFNSQLIFITGASGVGKSAMLAALQASASLPNATYLHFDAVGVPSEQSMVAQYGSGRAWQKAMLQQWLKKITNLSSPCDLVVLEGQVDIELIVQANQQFNLENSSIVLIHCNRRQREQRLNIYRKQPHLATDNMENWSNYLKAQAIAHKITLLDSTQLTVDQMVDWLIKYIISLY